jgi:hypothetical protein
MKLHAPFRLCLSAAFFLVLAAPPSFARMFGPKERPQPRQAQTPPRIESRPQFRSEQVNPSRAAGAASDGTPVREHHLQQWMENHKNLSLPEQQRALQNEPGFRELPPRVQQNQLNTLGRLYGMNPQQRNRMLNGVEGLERLSPQQQQQWDHAVQQLDGIVPPRRRMMMRAIIDLREMPIAQRQQVIDSPAFGAQFSPDERETIRTVLTAY